MLEGIDGISTTDGEVCKINKSHMNGVIYNNFLRFYPAGLNCSHVFTLLGRNPLRFASAAFGCIAPLQRKVEFLAVSLH